MIGHNGRAETDLRNENILKRHLCLSICQIIETIGNRIFPQDSFMLEENTSQMRNFSPGKRFHTVLATYQTTLQQIIEAKTG